MLSNDRAFVLFEDARLGKGAARLFSQPTEKIVAATLAEVPLALALVRAALRRGNYVAGWLGYEAGIAFEPRLMARATRHVDSRSPLLWFGVFDEVRNLTGDELTRALPDPAGAWMSMPCPRMKRARYEAAFNRLHRYIVAGDVYQVNLSYRADLTLLGNPLAAYARLRGAGQGGWSAVVRDEASWLLSTSPELFFRMSGRSVETKPMKGTARRAANPEEDRLAAERLRLDPKELAENIMIVDLLRNDLSRLAKRGTVSVPELFTVESYPTLHTLTSTIRAEIREEYDVVDVLGALFPCGSITGAPKIRAMEIIDELEMDDRGAYTGSIGWMAPDGTAEFNVAIRTLAVSGGRAELGLGSGIVYDSTAAGEWNECLIKGAFITSQADPFALIETMRFEPGTGIALLEQHIRRLASSACVFGFQFNARTIRARIAAAIANTTSPSSVRLLLHSDGKTSVELKGAPVRAERNAAVLVAPIPVAPDDFRLFHKTTNRRFYDVARLSAGSDEVVFVDASGYLTEGSFTNLFVERAGVLLTPPAGRGLLPGVLRSSLIEAGRAREADLSPEDLESGFLLGNALRGLFPARLMPGKDP